MLQTDWLKVATEGPTMEAPEFRRNIKAEWLSSMAETYDPDGVYAAAVNIDHFSIFGSGMGTVAALKAELDDRGRMALFARINPTSALLDVWQSRFKNFFSVEMVRDYPKKGQVYLAGLAVTDIPASVGLAPMKFSRGGTAEVWRNTAAMARPEQGDVADWREADPEELSAEEPGEEQAPRWARSFLASIRSLLAGAPEQPEEQAMTEQERQAFEALKGQVEELAGKVESLAAPPPAPEGEGDAGDGAAPEPFDAERLTALVAEAVKPLAERLEKVEQLMARSAGEDAGEVTGPAGGEEFRC